MKVKTLKPASAESRLLVVPVFGNSTGAVFAGAGVAVLAVVSCVAAGVSSLVAWTVAIDLDDAAAVISDDIRGVTTNVADVDDAAAVIGD